jgi:hypothetical protein
VNSVKRPRLTNAGGLLAIAGIHTFCAYFGNWQSVTSPVLEFQTQVDLPAIRDLASSFQTVLTGSDDCAFRINEQREILNTHMKVLDQGVAHTDISRPARLADATVVPSSTRI